MHRTMKLYNGQVVDSLHLIKVAFDKGFKSFQKGDYFNNPYDDGSWANKEWQRGQNAAYKMYYERNKVRESYRDNSSRN